MYKLYQNDMHKKIQNVNKHIVVYTS